MTKQAPFIERHALWSDEQARQAKALPQRVEAETLDLVRLAWVDSHGASHAKAVTPRAFKAALIDGYNINVATSTLDASGGRVFKSFERGGGMGLDEMTGSPNLAIVPQPETFRTLPWAPGVGWVLCDQYFGDGTPFHFSTRQVLKDQIAALAGDNQRCVIGLEIEWYLTRLVDTDLEAHHVGRPGMRGKAPQTRPIEPGYAYHGETNMDIMQPALTVLAQHYEALGLGLRSIENEWGPGQLECTFSAQDALEAADNFVLMRTATRQICRRMGLLATFMSRPALPGYYASGWHLHQSLVDAESGKNLFMPDKKGQVLSPLGLNWLGGLLHHGAATTVFATPTLNGYRRFVPNSLAPDRAVWGIDHRGVMVRAMGGPGDRATRLENRIGEPAANPYLFIASQIAAGRDGVAATRDPGPPETDPYKSGHDKLPASLADALELAGAAPLLQDAFGDIFMRYYIDLKRAELRRFQEYCTSSAAARDDGEVTAWEQDEYFDFF